METIIKEAYELAKKKYASIGVDTDAVLEKLQEIKISINCWQGDDINGFLSKEALTGGIQVTGNYPGKARNAKELREDLEFALHLIPGKHKVNLHSIYADTDEKVELNHLKPEHFKTWVEWAKKNGLGLDFNPTCFSHPMLKDGFTLSSVEEDVRKFWIKHCQDCLKIGEYFGKELGQKCVTNIWVPDGFKDIPYDRLAPRQRLKDSLDEVLSCDYDPQYNLVAVESKVFGIGAESYTTGSNEFVLGYATKNHIAVCLDAGHFHPTEVISDKISSVLLFTDELLLHVSRPVRWDSDHVVILDDELNQIAQALVRNDLLSRTHIGLDYFDATINRIAAWVIGTRNMIKALLKAMLEPTEKLKAIENSANYTDRLAIVEELKTFPFGDVFNYYCAKNHVPTDLKWLDEVHEYEEKVLKERV